MKSIIITLILLISSSNFIFGQSIEQNIIGSAGESFMNSVAEISYTIGEISIDTYGSNTSILSQGFHQTTLSITEVTDVGVDNEIDVFPNPANDNVIVQFHGFLNESRTIEVFDLLGQRVYEKELKSSEDQLKIDLSGVQSGQYIITIGARNGAILNSYRLVKLN